MAATNKSTDITLTGAELFLLPVTARMPLKFGTEVVTHVTCVRVRAVVADRDGRMAEGWGETPLSAQWAWPSAKLTYAQRDALMCAFCQALARDWLSQQTWGHPLEIGAAFQRQRLDPLLAQFNGEHAGEPMPHLAALVCLSALDIAVHDAYGNSLQRPVYATYNDQFMNGDLADHLEPADLFGGRFPGDFFVADPPKDVIAWHLVGGLDPLDESDPCDHQVSDDQPVLLTDWIERDGLKALKIKLRGNDAAWDYQRIVRVGRIAVDRDVPWLTADFNCTVHNPGYVNDMLDRLRDDHPRLYGMLLYVEQPFPYDLEAHRIDVHSLAARKPLFMDESAHDWRMIRLGRELGWNGVALKTCKTQTGAILSLCWAKAHGMGLMVQDLSNPMLAAIPHVLLAAHAGTIMGVETNAPQFFPAASAPEAAVHPRLYRRRQGTVGLQTLGDTGFGYRINEIARTLPEPVAAFGDVASAARASA